MLLIAIHSNIPINSGLKPTLLRTSTESDAPIKKSVIVSILRAMRLMPFPIVTPHSLFSSKYVFMSIAPTKRMMNVGTETFLFLLLKIKDVMKAIGTIHRARVSLMVVAICNASSPYAAPAPTTELVSCIAIAAHVPNCC